MVETAIEHHPLLDAVIDTGSAALPVKSAGGMLRFVRDLRAGKFDLMVSLVRSPLMSAAALLSGIPVRAGIDSAGRGFGYTLRAPVDPNLPRHEAEIYLDVIRALGLDPTGCRATIPVSAAPPPGLPSEYVVINPAGGRNPGMVLDSKRWPPENFAALANSVGFPVVLIGGPGDQALVEAVKARLTVPATEFVGVLTFEQIAALAQRAKLYLGTTLG